MDKTTKALNLIDDIDAKIRKWNERSQFTVKGVRNLSMADMDTLKFYAHRFLAAGSFEGLMEPRSEVRAVLIKYGLIEGDDAT